jgi:hypothetical protein
MSEIMARINAEHLVELIDDRLASIASVPPMTPQDTAFLARGMLACAAALTEVVGPPTAGAIVGDAQFPIVQWKTMTATATGLPVLILSIPPGIELTFALTLQVRSGTVH